ncbi:MAG: MBL fold metallo-hydrolase, partial [Elusimicrobiota bacterium]
MSSLLIKSITVGPIQTNCYLLIDEKSKQCLVIDPGDEPERIIQEIQASKLIPVGIVNTHGHYDHIGANSQIKQLYKVPIYIHKLDADCLTNPSK